MAGRKKPVAETVEIKILESVAGDSFTWSVGDVVPLPPEEAAKWADGYRAVYVDGSVDEAAAASTAEALGFAPAPVVVEVLADRPEDDAPVEAWATYARALGHEIDDEATVEEIVAIVGE